MAVRVYLLKQIPNEMLERTTGGQDLGLEPEQMTPLGVTGTTSSESNHQQQVSISLIFIH